MSIVGEGSQFDYTVNTLRVRALFASPTPDNVVVTFRVDAIAQEPNETFTLTLQPLGTAIERLMGTDGFFFRDTIEMIIEDSDSKKHYTHVVHGLTA